MPIDADWRAGAVFVIFNCWALAPVLSVFPRLEGAEELLAFVALPAACAWIVVSTIMARARIRLAIRAVVLFIVFSFGKQFVSEQLLPE
jgi:hypothetical protein